jgi:putative ABC transport system ATP-binding protein
MPAAKQALVGDGLTRSFGAGDTLTVALQEVSLSLSAGQVALILGPSGSGKSTLLAVLSGLLQPDRGRVRALGEDLWRLSPAERKRFRLRHCGFIFQGYNLFPALTARQHLELVLRWGRGVAAAEARRRAEQLLAVLGLRRQANLRPGQLSGGEQQRVAVGQALIKEPALCFADEPTGALDWAHGQQVIELLRSATRSRGAAVLVVAHDTRLVSYADRVFHMEDGRLSEQ